MIEPLTTDLEYLHAQSLDEGAEESGAEEAASAEVASLDIPIKKVRNPG